MDIEDPDEICSLGFQHRADPPSRKSVIDAIQDKGLARRDARDLEGLSGAKVRPTFENQLTSGRPAPVF